MIDASTITKENYEAGKAESLAASELQPTGRYEARLINDATLLESDAFAVVAYVRVRDLVQDGDYRLVSAEVDNESYTEISGRASVFGHAILYSYGEGSDGSEIGYFRDLPPDDLDKELLELQSKFEPIMRAQPAELLPVKHLEAPLPSTEDLERPG